MTLRIHGIPASRAIRPLWAATELGLAFDSIAELEPIGATDFGRLWRVRDAAASAQSVEPPFNTLWSITKAVQVGIIGAFVLLAIPSRTRRRSGSDSEIFVDAEESDV